MKKRTHNGIWQDHINNPNNSPAQTRKAPFLSKRNLLSSSISILMGAMSVTTYAQETHSRTFQQLEEIVVTAQKREEDLSTAPLAVSVVNQESLDQLGITSPEDIATTVPSLQNSLNGFAIRGIASTNAFSGYSTVAVHVDGIYEPTSAALSLGLFDVGRVEVLRGPQGTVYGRNATAGVVNFHTADPGHEFGGNADFSLGNHGDLQARGAIDIPVSDTFALRAAVQKRENDGWEDQGAAADKYNKIDQLSVRLTSLWDITDTLQWRLSASYGKDEGTIAATHLTNYLYYPDADIVAGVTGDPVVVNVDGENTYNPNQLTVTDNQKNLEQVAIRSRLIFDVNDEVSLTYLAGYTRFTNDGYDSATGVFTLNNQDVRTESMSHELDLNYESDSFSAVVGLYYYEDEMKGFQDIAIGGTAPAPFNTLFDAFNFIFPTIFAGTGNEFSASGNISVLSDIHARENTSKAAFAQGTYRFSDSMRLTLGVRHTKDDTSRDEISNICAFESITYPLNPGSCGAGLFLSAPDKHAADFSNTSWKSTFEYDVTPEVMLYGTIATGYRGGGLEAITNEPQYQQYAPEKLTNYEIGIRTTALDEKLSFNATAYFMDYEDLQVSTIVVDTNGANVPVTTNAATSETKGLEVESTYLLTDRDKISGFFTYMDASFTSFESAQNSSLQPDGLYNAIAGIAGVGILPDAIADYSGTRLYNAPKYSARIRYEHIFDIANSGQLAFAVDGYWQSKTYAQLGMSERGIRDAYSKFDVNLNYQPLEGNYYVNLYAHNIQDETVYSTITPMWSSTVATLQEPCTFGLRVGVNF